MCQLIDPGCDSARRFQRRSALILLTCMHTLQAAAKAANHSLRFNSVKDARNWKLPGWSRRGDALKRTKVH
jgi:hypothetical protein